jgi:hypothetical protein
LACERSIPRRLCRLTVCPRLDAHASHRFCERQAFGTSPRWCQVKQRSRPRSGCCGTLDRRFRRASLPLHVRTSGPFKIRFSAAKYSLCKSRSWSSVPVMYARRRARSTGFPFQPRRSAVAVPLTVSLLAIRPVLRGSRRARNFSSEAWRMIVRFFARSKPSSAHSANGTSQPL